MLCNRYVKDISARSNRKRRSVERLRHNKSKRKKLEESSRAAMKTRREEAELKNSSGATLAGFFFCLGVPKRRENNVSIHHGSCGCFPCPTVRGVLAVYGNVAQTFALSLPPQRKHRGYGTSLFKILDNVDGYRDRTGRSGRTLV